MRVGRSRSVQWVFVKISVNVLEREKKSYASFPNLEVVIAKAIKRIKTYCRIESMTEK